MSSPNKKEDEEPLPVLRNPKLGKEKDDEIALLDLTERGWLQRVFGDLTKASVAKQIAIGGASGWCAGYMFGKVGRAAAAAVGGSLLLLQIASHQGIIKVNWGRLEQEVNRAKSTLRKDVDKMGPALTQEVVDFVQANMFLAGGFGGGFFLGLAS